MTIKYTVSLLFFLFLSGSKSSDVFGQVDYTKLEPDWCKPHPSFQTAFAISNYETAEIPVSYDKSIGLTGWRSFFNHAAIFDSVPKTQEIWDYYRRCFEPFTDSLLFSGPTLYCSRICRNGQRAYVCLQSVNGGRNYFFTLVELDRIPTDITAELLIKAFRQTGRFSLPENTIDNARALSEMVRAFNQNTTVVNIAFQPANHSETAHSIQKSKKFYDALSKAGLKPGKANYVHLPAGFTSNSSFVCTNALVEDRIVLFVK